MSDLASSTAGPLVVRQVVAPVESYLDYREALREDFWFSCAYCTLTETEAATIAFTIDHYFPKKKNPHLEHVYGNLMWCCGHCNPLKWQRPTEIEKAKGYAFFRADEHIPEDHFEVKDVRIEGVTEKIGSYTIEVLDLNRATLKRIRDLRMRLFGARQMILRGMRVLTGVKLDMLREEARREVARLQRQMKERADECDEVLDEEVAKLLARSPNQDPDMEKPERAERRREYLATINAIGIPKR